MRKIDHLSVIWAEPRRRGRHVIGHLQRSAGTFQFWYESDLSSAYAHGFHRLPEFPDHRLSGAPYSERYLFALFAERIPAPSRADSKSMLAAWGGQQPDDQFEVLARSGGIRATDRLELAEYRAVEDPLHDPIELRVAGRRHMLDAARLDVGDEVTLHTESSNEADPHTVLLARDGRRAGYVPRQYARWISGLLVADAKLHAVVTRQLLVPDDADKWVVRVTRTG